MCSAEVQVTMSQVKMFAVHAEADTKSELIARMKGALAELEGLNPIPEKPAKKETAPATPATPATAPEKPAKAAAKKEAPAGPKITLDQIKQALTKLRSAVGGDEDAEKKGIKAVKLVLKKFGVAQSPDLPENDFAEVMVAIEAAMPKADEAGESDGESY